MKTKIFIIAIFFSQAVLSQTIYKSSIDNGGASVRVGNIEMVYTIGEVNVQEVTVGNISISEGFIGPNRVPSTILINKGFVPGWNWFSVNILNDDMSLGNLLTCASDGDYIKNQTLSATFYDSYGWYGSLEDAGGLDPHSSYKIKTINACAISYSGLPVDVLSSSIDIVSGWNWIGYLPQCALPLIPDNEALISLTLEEGDYIKNQTASATYYNSYGWYGSLEVMEPSDGYMLKKQTGDVLIYPVYPPAGAGTKKTASAIKSVPGGSLDPHQFEFNGTVTARVYLDGALTGGEEDLVLAYVDDQLRGISEGIYFDPASAYAFPLMVYSNLAEGETMKFKYYDAKSDQLYPCFESLVFSKDMIIADAFESFKLNVNTAVGMDDRNGFSDLSLNVYPNPFNDLLHIEYSVAERTTVQIAIYDMLGKEIEIIEQATRNPGGYSTRWNAEVYEDGTYLIKMTTQNSSMRQKVILVR